MSFPFNDDFWVATAGFLSTHHRPGEKVLAPDLFWRILPEVYRYIETFRSARIDYDWIVVHKGLLADLDRSFLQSVTGERTPVFANEVFVVFAATGRPELPSLAESPHVLSLHDMIASLEPETRPSEAWPDGDEPGVIRQFATLTQLQLRDEMNTFWRRGGYLYETLRDRTYTSEIDAYLADFVGDCEGRDVLDLCCGNGHHLKKFVRAARATGIDISDAAIEFAKQGPRPPHVSFQQMDAHRLTFDDASFDIVIFNDFIEHVHDAGQVLSEASRVTRPGGLLYVTVANRNSLHLVMTRKLGFTEFRTNHHHIREFNAGEARQLLADAGYTVQRHGGIFLYAYWGIPGIDQIVRHLIDDDPEVVELHRKIGRALGAEHAYTSVFLARKSSQ